MRGRRKRPLLLTLLALLALSGCGRPTKPTAPPAPSPPPVPQESAAFPTTRLQPMDIPSPSPTRSPPSQETATPTSQPRDLPSPTPVPAQQTTSPPPSPTPTPVTQEMSITIVYDNNGFDDRLQTEWGFACWVEYGEHTILFDTGGDGDILLENMAQLDLDPRRIELVVLSHEHGDHTFGLDELLAMHSEVTVIMPQSFPNDLKRQVEDAGAELVEVSGSAELLPGLYSTGEMGRNIIEQALVARSTQGLVVITGCAHPGIVPWRLSPGE